MSKLDLNNPEDVSKLAEAFAGNANGQSEPLAALQNICKQYGLTIVNQERLVELLNSERTLDVTSKVMAEANGNRPPDPKFSVNQGRGIYSPDPLPEVFATPVV